MHRRSSALVSVALGAVLVISPSLSNLGADHFYDQALAAKGGNGKGNGGNAGGKGQSAGKNGSSKSGNATSVASASAAGKQKAKEQALNDPLAPAHPSMLGRWNAAKPIDHPSIQAHIRKGKFNGTIGMVAAYAQAQLNYDNYQSSLAEADPAVSALASALTTAGYKTVAEYNAAVVAGAPPDPAIDAALSTTTGETTTAMTAEQIAQAEALVEQSATAFADLSAAEATMEANSNRAPWSDIRDDVRTKMGLEPLENDLVAETPTDPAEPLTP